MIQNQRWMNVVNYITILKLHSNYNIQELLVKLISQDKVHEAEILVSSLTEFQIVKLLSSLSTLETYQSSYTNKAQCIGSKTGSKVEV